MRTFLSILFISTLMASVGTTATAKRIVQPSRDKMCWYTFTPDEELVCVDITP